MSSDVCMLDLLGIGKSVKQSCFSDSQINTLFQKWKEFMRTKFTPQEVNALYPNANTVENKYNALRLDNKSGLSGEQPALSCQEFAWVMGNETPTPFIAFLKKDNQLMEFLRMSFKPKLLHKGMLEAPDLITLLLRYMFWFQDDRERKLNVLGVANDDRENPMQATTNNMVQNLETNWTNARFHLAVVNESQHWRAVLIDRKQKTFEYYDPLGEDIDLQNETSPLSRQVNRLLQVSKSLESKLITKSMKSVRRGFHKHQRQGLECGMYVILFVHTRVAELKTFDYFADQDITHANCVKLRKVFFHHSDNQKNNGKNPKNHTHTRTVTIQNPITGQTTTTTTIATQKPMSKYENYDIRVAALEFIRYMDMLKSVMKGNAALQSQLQNDQQAMFTVATKDEEPVFVRRKGIEVNERLERALPQQIQQQVWYIIMKEIGTDPYTIFLRNIRKKKSRGGKLRRNKKLRQTHAMNTFQSLTTRPSFSMAAKNRLNEFVTKLLNLYYVPIINFQHNYSSKFFPDMFAITFVKESVAHQSTVSFAVHFLREIHNFVTKELQIQVDTELDAPDFQVKSELVKPTTAYNIHDVRQVITKCDATMKKAYELIQNTYRKHLTNQKNTVSNNNNNNNATVMSRLTSNNSNSNNMDEKLVSMIVELNYKDIVDQQFLENGLQPWNFPLSNQNFTDNVPLPSHFVKYTINERQRRMLLENKKFLLYFAMEVMIAAHFIRTDVLTDVHSIQIMFTSLVQFYRSTKHQPFHRNIMCTLLNELYQSVQSKASLINHDRLQNMLLYISQFRRECQVTNAINNTTPFFQQVNQLYSQIVSR